MPAHKFNHKATICGCVESTVNAEFLQRVCVAQQADSEMGDILWLLSSPTYDISQDLTCQLYSLEEGLLVVLEMTWVCIIIPSGDLHIELLSIHQDSAGHPVKDSMLHALQQHYFWPNMAHVLCLMYAMSSC